jgi:hypothetical protein
MSLTGLEGLLLTTTVSDHNVAGDRAIVLPRRRSALQPVIPV